MVNLPATRGRERATEKAARDWHPERLGEKTGRSTDGRNGWEAVKRPGRASVCGPAPGPESANPRATQRDDVCGSRGSVQQTPQSPAILQAAAQAAAVSTVPGTSDNVSYVRLWTRFSQGNSRIGCRADLAEIWASCGLGRSLASRATGAAASPEIAAASGPPHRRQNRHFGRWNRRSNFGPS